MYFRNLERGELGTGDIWFIVFAEFGGIPAVIVSLWQNIAWFLLLSLAVVIGVPALVLYLAATRN